jgi:hypothetical protein
MQKITLLGSIQLKTLDFFSILVGEIDSKELFLESERKRGI